MLHKGLAKLTEETGELNQVIGKMLNFPETDYHPDGGPPLTVRLAEEIADVLAACAYVAQRHGLNMEAIEKRVEKKTLQYLEWEKGDDYPT